MPIIDSKMFASAGISMGKYASKYANTIDQNGKIVAPSMADANLRYDSLFRIMALQDLREYTQRFQWVNIPRGLNASLIERILYYRFKGLMYYNDEPEKFQFLPFALNNTIDEYGRYISCNSLPFIGVSEKEAKKGEKKVSYVKQDIDIVYDDLFPVGVDITPEDEAIITAEWESGSDKGIILNDYELGVSQDQTPRFGFIQPILHSMATCMQIINTAMFASADYNIVKAEIEDDYTAFKKSLDNIPNEILKGNRFGVVVGGINTESLRTTQASNLQDLWETYNSLDNFRKSTAGIANSGVFNKKERMLQQEQQLNGTNADSIYADGLWQRQRFCDLFNQYYGANMWCVSKQTPTDVEQANDQNGDGSDAGTEQKQQQEQGGGDGE